MKSRISGFGPIHGRFLTLLVLSCGVFWIPVSGQAQTICNQQPAVQVNNNAYHVQNNEFGSTAPECINVNGTSFNVTQSAIDNTRSIPPHPGAYPSIYVGCHWGSCTSLPSSNLPVQVSALSSARSDWNTTQPSSGTYNAAYDIWFNKTPTTQATQGQPNGAELMIWLVTLRT